MPDPASARPHCRRCSECEGQEHHWLDDVTDDEKPVLACKHCGATQDYPDDDDDPETCPHGVSFCDPCERCDDFDEDDDAE